MSTSLRSLAPLASLGLVFAACSGDDPERDAGGFINQDATVTVDSGIHADATVQPDAEPTDTGEADAGFPDAEPMDADGPMDAEPMDADTPDGGMADVNTQIAAVRGILGMIDPVLPVSGAWVTYVRPAIGDDPAGFFVQGSAMGPALFVAIDPATLTPAPAVGDEVAFEVSLTEEGPGGHHRVAAIQALSVLSNGNDVSTFVQDLSTETNVVSALDSYASELVSISGTLTGNFRFAGNAHQRIQLSTAGLPDEADLSFRTPEALIGPQGWLPGCTVTVGPVPMWRFAANAQISVTGAGEVTVTACANAPTLLRAQATSDTTVELTFDRPIDPATVAAGQFTLQPALTVGAAATAGTIVTLTTSMMAEFQMYTVTVGTGVTDDLGAAIDTNANTAMFRAPGMAVAPAAAGDFIITEIMQNPDAASGEWFEIYNPGTSALNLNGCLLSNVDGTDSSTLAQDIFVLGGGYATLAGNANPGFNPTAVWPSFNLGNGGDEIIISCGGTVIDEVAYDGGPLFPDPDGRSMTLAAAALNATANDLGRNWCFGQTSYNGDLGTPGAPNDTCTSNPPNTMQPSMAGELVITEILQNASGSDDGKEWFEIYNPSNANTYNLYGCDFGNTNGPEVVVREDFVISPMSYVTVGTSTDGVGSHGFAVDLVLPGRAMTLGNGSDQVIITCGGGATPTVIDGVAYDNGNTFPDPNGASMNLDPTFRNATDNDNGNNWCVGTTLYDGTNAGTPGMANVSCAAPPDAGVMDSGAMIDAGTPDTGVTPDAGTPDTGVTPDAGVDAGTPDTGVTPDAGTGVGRMGLSINEVDYDQPGSDTVEFVEIYNNSATAIDLTNVAVVMVNGSGGAEYRRVALSGSLAAGAFLVVGNAAVTVPTGVTFVTLPSNGLQNGAPDGVALIDTMSNTLIDALSYEGSITAANITGFANPVSLVEGTAATAIDNTDGSLIRLPDGSDTDDADTDFSFTATPTPGAVNVP